jgi:hypothetical protein
VSERPDDRFKVVCTGRGTHKRYTFNEVTVTGAEIKIRATRVANMPDFKGGTIEGMQVPAYALTRTYNPRHGAAGWRWKCDLCGTDSRFSDDDDLRAWLETTRRVADISQRN